VTVAIAKASRRDARSLRRSAYSGTLTRDGGRRAAIYLSMVPGGAHTGTASTAPRDAIGREAGPTRPSQAKAHNEVETSKPAAPHRIGRARGRPRSEIGRAHV